MKIIKDITYKIILMEFHDNTQLIPVEVESGEIFHCTGFKPHKIYDHESNLLASYNVAEDRTPMDAIKDRNGDFVVAVVIDPKNMQAVWMKWIIADITPEYTLLLESQTYCDIDESSLLDEQFPEYRQKCFIKEDT